MLLQLVCFSGYTSYQMGWDAVPSNSVLTELGHT